MESVQLLTHVNASEEEWVQIVKLIVDVEDMEHAIQMALVNAIKDSFSTQLPKNANLIAMVLAVISAMVLI
jgi:hypothetical protein